MLLMHVIQRPLQKLKMISLKLLILMTDFRILEAHLVLQAATETKMGSGFKEDPAMNTGERALKKR
jgi:hypothetical protein